ncbi:MAG: PASTA domain-containing protein [Ardenticatenaceae bacterium]|nr:PASTA domain-containing protein [Ardenticatenaceae bacterium]
MPFNIVGFLAGRAVAENAGVDRQRATQLAILPGALNLPLPIGLVTARSIAQREASTVTPPGTSTPSDDTGQDNLINIPDVLGKSLEEAKELLKDAGFINFGFNGKESTAEQKDKVIEQKPVANTPIAKDDPMIVFIGIGIDIIKVPDVRYKPYEEAVQILKAKRLVALKVSEPSNSPSNYVTDQYPLPWSDPPNETYPPETQVTLTVSSGPPPMVTVPNVVGQTQEVATGILEGAGLEVSDVNNEPSSEIEEGKVTRQTLVAGTQVQPGTNIILTVSKGNMLTRVPNVVGQTQEVATGILEGAGLKVSPDVSDELSEDNLKGKVIRQVPVSDSQVEPGTSIKLTIGLGGQG